MEHITLFADILLPLPIPGTFTYCVPFQFNSAVSVGQRVTVQFGRKKLYTGLVVKVHENHPGKGIPKYIQEILDKEPIVNDLQFRFWNWIAEYYMSYLGEVMNAALPSSLKLMSESKILLSDSFVPDRQNLNETEFRITEALLRKKKITIDETAEIAGFKKVLPVIKTLIEKHLVVMEEELKDSYRPKKEKFVSLHENLLVEEKLQETMDTLGKRAHKQLEIVMSFIEISGFPLEQSKIVKRSELLQRSKASIAALNALIEKGIFVQQDKIVSRFGQNQSTATAGSIVLSKNQKEALTSIKEQMEKVNIVLLHGVTSSGKTELYIKLIQETLQSGRQVLYLLPEIALTSQIIGRLRKYFGDEVGIYHSRYNPNERAEVWYNLLGKQQNEEQPPYKIVLGPRSAMFLPFDNLGLVIIDEEHDSSYKQFDPAPRYNARDAAIYLARLHNAKVLLGSATPSVESYFNAKQKKYGIVKLNERYGGIEMPEIIVVNMKNERRRRLLKSHFSSVLLQHIAKALENEQQVILFQNRRGFSPRIECEQCNWVPQCKNCDVTLTYHKKSELLKCHYCGFSISVPPVCAECGSPNLKMLGFGTEKVEEELSIMLPQAKIDRMDLDSTRSKNAFLRIFSDFENRKTDILTGTQMVAKGLDFDNVQIVGILSADNMLSFPDFRAHERSFQMMEQVSGRAGRKNKRGTVIIQTWNHRHPIIKEVVMHDFEEMFNTQLAERRRYLYPPYYRLLIIKLKHARYEILNQAAAVLAKEMRSNFGKMVYGPEYPVVSRIRNKYIKQIMLKIARNNQLTAQKTLIKNTLDKFKTLTKYKSVRISIDVDPQ